MRNIILTSVVLGVAATTVPTHTQFNEYFKSNISTLVGNEICTAPPTLENSISNALCNGFTENLVVPVAMELLKQSSSYENYFIFSRVVVEGANDTQLVVVGALNNFWITKNNLSTNLSPPHQAPQTTTQPPAMTTEQSPTPTRVADTFFNESFAYPQWAKDFIKYYYDSLNNREYSTAWTLLSSDFTARGTGLTYAEYVEFWDTIANTRVESIKVLSVNKHAVILEVDITYTTIEGKVIKDTTPYIRLVIDENGYWSLDEKSKTILH